ncbi:MAG TPA: ribonuclease H-like domain-containing protein [Abditibacteriaceae bacterium]|jgi:uncharacterized protein YprB with RNaseH-like and TPR domain
MIEDHSAAHNDTPSKPLSRAQRLMAASLAAQAQATNTQAVALPKPGGKPASVKPGAAARALNKRIKEVLREQEETVYATPDAKPTTELSVASSSSPSWEDIADEIAPAANGKKPRGLATGAMRGAALPKTDSLTNKHTTWLQEPIEPRAIFCPTAAPDASLQDVLNGEERLCPDNGVHYLIARNAAEYDAEFSTLSTRLESVLQRECFPQLSGARLQDLLFVDIETTGLSSSVPLFLVGALDFDNAQQQPQLQLFLARDYPEERALLAAFHKIAAGRTLVTFNGKSFDWPYIEGRSIGHRLKFEKPRAHFDLLHFARRQWKHSLPNCKLQTLELYLCGRTRIDDVAGSQIPRTYHEFVATHARNGSGAHLLAPVIHHNALDILTMAELLCKAGEEI